jgi:exosortase H (IPTLxxWG-CTERM-specific)
VTQQQRDAGAGGAPSPERAKGALARLFAFWQVPTYRFAITFLGFLLAIALGYPWLRTRSGFLLAHAERGTAVLVYHLLALFSSEATLAPERPSVVFRSFPVTIVEECTGLYEALLLGAALLAYPTTWRKTLVGFAIGFPLIYALNVARILMLLVVGDLYPQAFNFMHVYFWQVTMIVMVVTVMYVWVRWVVREEAAQAA